MKKFGDNLRYIRQINGISQNSLAKKMDTTQQRVSEWERGLVEPSLYNILNLIEVLNTSFEELTDGIYKKNK